MLHQGKSQISLRLPTDIVKQFDRIAELLERDRTWVMLQAMKLYLEQDGGDILEDAIGLAELDRGEGVPLEDVLENARRIVAEAEKARGSR